MDSLCSPAAFAQSLHHATGAQSAYYASGVTCGKLSSFRGTLALIGHPARDTSKRCRLLHLMAWKRLWPPPDDDKRDLRGGSGQDGDEGDARVDGDAAELSMWLLLGLGEAGSSKKKASAVRLELFALDIPLTSVLECLFEVCRLAPHERNSSGRLAAEPSARRSGRGEGTEDHKKCDSRSIREALPSAGAAYDTAVDLLLEYAGELMALAADSTSPVFDRLDSLARDSVTPTPDNVQIKSRPVASGGITLSASVRQQVKCICVHAHVVCESSVYMGGMRMVQTCAHEYLLVWVRVFARNPPPFARTHTQNPAREPFSCTHAGTRSPTSISYSKSPI